MSKDWGVLGNNTEHRKKSPEGWWSCPEQIYKFCSFQTSAIKTPSGFCPSNLLLQPWGCCCFPKIHCQLLAAAEAPGTCWKFCLDKNNMVWSLFFIPSLCNLPSQFELGVFNRNIKTYKAQNNFSSVKWVSEGSQGSQITVIRGVFNEFNHEIFLSKGHMSSSEWPWLVRPSPAGTGT